jgi:hypothetical protein
MLHSDQPQLELDHAKAAVGAMRASQSLDAFEEGWKEFLHRLERSCNKAAAHFHRSPKWSGWQSRFARLRKDDPLLCYLMQARHADEHTVNQIVDREPERVGINPAQGDSLYIERMVIRNGTLSIRSPQALRIDFSPARTRLLPAINRGQTYPVPTSHLGQSIEPDNALLAAGLALEFYQSALSEAEAFFVK